MIKEFREFLNRGNVVDLAVAVILGAAFTAIIRSLVDDIIMPLIGVLLGGLDLTTLSVQVGEAAILYGLFFQAIINFFIIALIVFLVVRYYNRLMRKQTEVAAISPAPSAEEKLLTEIRDLLSERPR